MSLLLKRRAGKYYEVEADLQVVTFRRSSRDGKRAAEHQMRAMKIKRYEKEGPFQVAALAEAGGAG